VYTKAVAVKTLVVEPPHPVISSTEKKKEEGFSLPPFLGGSRNFPFFFLFSRLTKKSVNGSTGLLTGKWKTIKKSGFKKS